MTSKTAALLLFLTIAAPAASAAELEGRVLLDGPLPAAEKVTIEPKKGGSHSTEGCDPLVKESQRLRVGSSGGVRDAVVWTPLEEAYLSNRESQRLDQRKCVFEPHVTVTPSPRIAIRNSDSVIHNVRIFREGKPDMLMHRWQKPGAADILWQLPGFGRYVVRCGVHPWMYAWIIVMPTGRAAVTDASGRFTLEGLPAGRHILHVWHEALGEKEISVEVGPGPATQMEPIRFRREGA